MLPEKITARLAKEGITDLPEYGRDWVNLGYRPGGSIFIQGLAKSDNIVDFLGKDAFGTDLSTLAVFKNVRTLKNVKMVLPVNIFTRVWPSSIRS